MKSFMRRRIVMLMGIIMSIAVVGVGFAAWVITAPTEDASANGNIKVEEVTEETSWSFDAYWVNSATYQPVSSGEDKGKLTDNPTIVFGTPKDPIADAWLSNDEIGEETLKAYLYVKAVAGDDEEALATASGTVTLNAVIPSETPGEDPEIVELNTYLGDYASVTVTDSALDSTELGQGVVLTIEFKWNTFATKTKVETPTEPVEGEVQEETYNYTYVQSNPYTYYNNAEYSIDLANLANEYLTGLYNLLAEIEFQVLLQAE